MLSRMRFRETPCSRQCVCVCDEEERRRRWWGGGKEPERGGGGLVARRAMNAGNNMGLGDGKNRRKAEQGQKEEEK